MEVRVSSASRNRAFSKAIQRIRPSIQIVLDEIGSTELENPTWSTLLIALTDDLEPEVLNEKSTDGGVLQLLAGFPALSDWSPGNDQVIRQSILETIQKALIQCELTPADYERLKSMIKSVP
ncbi:MAG: hypothetical protein ACKVH8_08555 [Pirellulales bacterium]